MKISLCQGSLSPRQTIIEITLKLATVQKECQLYRAKPREVKVNSNKLLSNTNVKRVKHSYLPPH